MTRVKKDNTMLTTRDVASLLNVDINTVRRWTNHGILKAYRVGPRRDRRFRQEDINLFLMNNHVKTPAPIGYHSKEYIPPDESRDVGEINNRREQ